MVAKDRSIDIGNELPDPDQELQDWLDQNAISGDRFKKPFTAHCVA